MVAAIETNAFLAVVGIRRRRGLMTKNRFDGRHDPELSEAAQQFGSAMTAYLHGRGPRYTGGEVLDVLYTLGYRHPDEHEWLKRVDSMTRALARLRRMRRFPTFSEVLALALRLDWRRSAAALEK